jgi:uncharacterized membrane-anchored protein
VKTRWFVLVVVLAQLALVSGMAVQREWIVRRGATVRLRTAPLDPNDPMRGAYSRLRFEINRVPAAFCQGELKSWFEAGRRGDYRQLRRYRDEVVYASLVEEPDGLIKLRSLSNVRPTSGRFIRGRVESVDSGEVSVRYGIEAYFSSQAEAQRLDRERSQERLGARLDAEIALGSQGLAVLKRVEWEPLALTIRRPEPTRTIRPAGTPPPPIPSTVELELKNGGTEPLAIIVRPGGRSFRLLDAGNASNQMYTWVNADQPLPPVTPEVVRVLKPGEIHREMLDLRDPYWNVRRLKPHPQHPVGEVISPIDMVEAWATSFRFEYTPGVAGASLTTTARVWTLRLTSARWSPRGVID